MFFTTQKKNITKHFVKIVRFCCCYYFCCSSFSLVKDSFQHYKKESGKQIYDHRNQNEFWSLKSVSCLRSYGDYEIQKYIFDRLVSIFFRKLCIRFDELRGMHCSESADEWFEVSREKKKVWAQWPVWEPIITSLVWFGIEYVFSCDMESVWMAEERFKSMWCGKHTDKLEHCNIEWMKYIIIHSEVSISHTAHTHTPIPV